MTNNRTAAQTRWGLGMSEAEAAPERKACARCSGKGRDRADEQCPDCAGTGKSLSQSS